MRKGEKTREYIIMQAAELFNQQGYFGSSMADIMQVTGLRKGGIYNHFESKDELALAAFDYAVDVLSRAYLEAIKGKKTVAEQLIAIVSVYKNVVEAPPLKGGCPILNTAIESDDTHPALREKAAQAMDQFLNFLHMLINRGIRKGEIKEDADPESIAIFITSTMEGAVMLSKLYQDNHYIQQALEQLRVYINGLQVKHS